MLLANGFCKSSEQGDFPYINIYVFKFPTPENTIYKDTNLTFDNFIVENMLFAYAIVRTYYFICYSSRFVRYRLSRFSSAT